MNKRYLLFPVLALVLLQNPTPRPTPQTTEGRPPNQKSESAKQQADTAQRGSEQSPLVIKILSPEQAQKESGYDSEKRPNHPTNSWSLSDKIAVIASIVAFLQFLALVVTIFVISRIGRRQLRAYVLPENSGILEGNMLNPPQPAKANIPGVGMLIKNGGFTPAFNVRSLAQIAVIPVVNENTALVVLPLPQQYPLTLGAGSTFSKAQWFNRALTPQEITDIAIGVQAIYLYGRIEYTDIFKRNHFANFRLHYTGQFPPLPTAYFLFSQGGNSAD
jgi:hypothetical protein